MDPAQDAKETPPLSEVRGTNQSGMRAQNERLVLSLVRRHGALPKADIARITGLSPQTVSVIMRALEHEGLLARGEPRRGKVGQPSVPMHLNAEGAFFLGLKVGRRSTEVIVADFLGKVRGRRRQTYAYPTPDETLRFADESVRDLAQGMTPPHRARISGLGIAMPFFLWDWAQTLQVPQEKMDPWRHADLRQSLQSSLDMPVLLQNDATAACGAELVFGPSEGPREFLYFYVGYFIGGGVALNGHVFSGRGNAGALGPLPVQGRDGQLRPLIDVASLYTLERALVRNGQAAGAMWESPEHWDIPEPLLEDWIAEAADGIAQSIQSACSLIDFECVKIDGWLPAPVRDRLIAQVEQRLGKANLTGLERPRVIAGSVGPDARALGAASLPLSRKYLVEA